MRIVDAAQTLPVFPWGPSQIEALLPHRDPFVWVSAVRSCSPGEEIVAELALDCDLPLFRGHFPDYPVLPGVIIMEALAQAACLCLMSAPEREHGSIGFLTGIDGARFRRQVKPGDVVELRASIEKSSKRLCKARVCALVEGEVCAEALQTYVLARTEAK